MKRRELRVSTRSLTQPDLLSAYAETHYHVVRQDKTPTDSIRSLDPTEKGQALPRLEKLPSLEQCFNPRLNSLNAIRLILAVSVIVAHSWPLTGRHLGGPLDTLGVDGFFILSGYLIAGSWVRNPKWSAFLLARGRRILPGFWVALVVTAFLLAPIGAAFQGVDGWKLITSGESLSYVVQNAALYIFEHRVGGTPVGLPYSDSWNGSLWTLQWEAFCYVGLLVLGLTGLLRRKWFVASLTLVFWSLYTALHGRLDRSIFLESRLDDGIRFAMLFLVGVLIFTLARRIPITWPLVVAAAVLLAVSLFLPDYRILGVWPYAYLLVAVGALVKLPWLALRNDFSYGVYIYAFPIQQILASTVLVALPIWGFAGISVVVTLPLAVASWFLVEKPSSKLFARKRPDMAPTVGPLSATTGEPT
ncbi:acyltransferase [Plantibacter sp. ME-Dv--P-122b]|uniref:acyltransferase family protein n=1 Tax=Plantibacter sp. ME-Dv--P-122b TaxID=3040300 RepID=UPI00254EF832|nr:acyltransferase [Plantibacter sp. ME-Dv--P-122b]